MGNWPLGTYTVDDYVVVKHVKLIQVASAIGELQHSKI